MVSMSCSNNDAKQEIETLKAEITRLKQNDNKDFSNHSEKREEIVERYESGAKKLIVTYDGSGTDEFVSKRITYYPNGQIKEVEHYKDSELHGDYREYYKNGQISVKVNYIDGKKNGEYFEFYYDGVIWEHAFYTNGDYNGEYITYFINGKIKSYELYKQGDRIEAIWYDHNGNVEYEN